MFTDNAPSNPSFFSPQDATLTDRGVFCGQRGVSSRTPTGAHPLAPQPPVVCSWARRGCICPIGGVSPPLPGEFLLHRFSSAFWNASRLDLVRTSASPRVHVHVQHTFACDRNEDARATCLQLPWSAVVWKEDTTKGSVGMGLAPVWIHG